MLRPTVARLDHSPGGNVRCGVVQLPVHRPNKHLYRSITDAIYASPIPSNSVAIRLASLSLETEKSPYDEKESKRKLTDAAEDPDNERF